MQTSKHFQLLNIRIDILFAIFLVLQPIFDIYRTFWGDTFSIGPFAIEEFVNLGMLGLLFLISLLQTIHRKQSKNLLPYGLYFALIAVYLVLHCTNIQQFDQSILPAASIHLLTECYYIFRTYLCPLLLMFLFWKNGMEDLLFARTIKVITCIISGVIVVTNLLGISLVAYSGENQQIAGSIFSWPMLTPSMTEAELAMYTSKGWFQSSNQISALLFSLCPIIVKEVIKKPSWSNSLLLTLQVISMTMLGTRTASLGCILVIVAMTLVLLALHILHLERIRKVRALPILLLIVLLGSLLSYCSPGQLSKRLNEQEAIIERPEAEEAKPSGQNSVSLAEYLEEYAYNYYINDWFLEIYPVSGDEAFWREVIARDRTLNMDNRSFKIEMLQRIKERNARTDDTLYGMGYTSNVPYTERDYVYQYYIFGILGVVLLMGPFLFALGYGGLRLLLHPRQYLTLENCALLMALGCMLCIAFFSGHVFGILINMLFLGTYAGKLLSNLKTSRVCEDAQV